MPEASLKQLLDALRNDDIVSELQEEEILQKSPLRADKARAFVDYVKNQGEAACKKMIEHFKALDPVLSSELGFSSAHPALKDKEPQSLASKGYEPNCTSFDHSG
ncbi:unnamed protein product [Menidia menidia]|uniref:(Atlantic silverside) hypothetical protein n=1 Tax=Menidia menidia TaxID=238744 RepID=A0A8S4BWY4_9TELE|nr:unnamed protein product [Menidia menidia]